MVATVSYDYDIQGRLVKAVNAEAVVEFDYDDAGQLITERLNGSAVNRSWQYDPAYNVVGIDDGRWGKTHYQYDQND